MNTTLPEDHSSSVSVPAEKASSKAPTGYTSILFVIAFLALYPLSFGPALAYLDALITTHDHFFSYGLHYVKKDYRRKMGSLESQLLYPLYVPLHFVADNVYGAGYLLTKWARLCGAKSIGNNDIYISTPQKGIVLPGKAEINYQYQFGSSTTTTTNSAPASRP